MDDKQLDRQYVENTYARQDLLLDHGKGALVWDENGREYIDLGSGIGVNALGHADEGWLQAVTGQLKKLAHTSNLYYTAPCARLAEELCTRTGQEKAFFCNSGAEANECAIKAARKYSFTRYGAGRHVIVTLQNSFHGRTMATLSATGQDAFHRYFDPFPEGFRYAPANDLAGTLAALRGDVCALLFEPIQGEGGVVELDHGYLQKLAAVCREQDILLIADEVQTGIGRTGKLLGCEHSGVRPDIVTLAKGLGGGLPIGAALFGERAAGTRQAGDHGSTFGGNPAVCAGACEVLRRLDDGFLAEVEKKGDYLRGRLLATPNVREVSGRGLMLGVALREGISPAEVVKAAIAKGVIPLTAHERLRLLPPLVITGGELTRASDILCDVIAGF